MDRQFLKIFEIKLFHPFLRTLRINEGFYDFKKFEIIKITKI